VEAAFIDALPITEDHPRYYAMASDGFVLWPTPDDSYDLTIRYYGNITPLSADADVSAINPDWHDVMVSFALYEAYKAEDDAQMSQYHYANFQRDLQLLGSDRMAETMDKPQPVQASIPAKRQSASPATPIPADPPQPQR
jgi:hypothetical protein